MAKFNYNPFTGNLDQMPSQATSTAQGIITSFTPIVNSRYNSVSSADYTVLDNDGYEQILMTTGNSNRTVTLPTAADNAGRLITVSKIDSGTGNVVIDGEGAETISGSATVTMYSQYMSITMVCNGTNWQITASTLYPIGFEVKSGAPSNVTTNTATFVNVNSISLTPGVWDISGVGMSNNDATQNGFALYLSAFTGATITDLVYGDNAISINCVAGQGTACSIPPWRQTVTTTTTYYVKAVSNTAAGQVKGIIRAIRVG